MASAACSTEEKVPCQLSPTSASGRPAQIQAGTLAVEVVSGGGTVELVDDLNFFVVSGDLPGSTQYTVKADADLGEGVVEISDVIDLEVSGANAVNLGLSVGAPVPK